MCASSIDDMKQEKTKKQKHDLEKIGVDKGGGSEGENGITRQIKPQTKDCLKQMTLLHLLSSLSNDDGPIRPVQKEREK